ncbi:ABC-type glutathione transport system ATPase component [Virgibacillus natechei]|uniref:Nickel import system ATP-binding protein NikD n=1 Tax=Virgibacillus natechei TaxID=1216297 RepID=A0ABS4IDS7_9BACI|nr:ATP-binding cassette domain-containing protein [Virgibacillus natechei]MBP1968606.1 ABC-type glutathione transport system ATPase component [Virgibacillus natechei]UZD13715.1 ATP-binding cassette domain-containing protein [Virgibacillus natechei]
MTLDKTPLLEVKDLSLSFRQYKKGLRETTMQVIHRLDMKIYEGEIVAVIGASGSGKSLLANAILGILPEHAQLSGILNYKGEPITAEKQTALRGKEISLIPQSVHALDPLMKTSKQVQAVVRKGNRKTTQREVFQQIGLPIEVEKQYPFELSGGMARRVLAATSIISSANLIIADEPTPGLDPHALNETVYPIKELATAGKGIMFITHDINTALKIADRVVVMNEGETVDQANVEDFTGKGERLKHPYTRKLWNVLPQNDFVSLKSPPVNAMVKPMDGSLVVKEMAYHYPNESPIFEQLNLKLNAGEVVGLFGYSGSGKSTMAQLIAGYMNPHEGTVEVDGETDFRARIHPVQLIWQHPEAVINPKWQMKKILTEAQVSDKELLQVLEIKEEWLSRYPSELSGGELQRFCVARALHENTKYIIADEMTTMLDAITQAQIWQAVLKLARQRNIGVLAISHDHHLLQRVSDRVIDFETLENREA